MTYEDYMCNQPMRDGEEITNFFDEIKGTNESFELTLHSPLTKEDWNKILDVELDHTPFFTFQTPQGKQVRYIKCDVLDKIRAEIWDLKYGDEEKSMTDENRADAYNCAVKQVLEIIDKYKVERNV